MNNRPGNVTIENARIVFRNFAGREERFNPAGRRNFGVILPDDVAEQMVKDGWNVKYLKPREEDEQPQPWLQVAISYKVRPPRVVMVTSRGRTSLPEELIEALDYADLAVVDLIVNPYSWTVDGKSGIKAYLTSIFVTIAEDDLERKYADVPEIDIHGKPLALEAGPGDDFIDAEVIDAEVVEED